MDDDLEIGRSAHFSDPAYYTSAYRKRVEDVGYYAELALVHGGPVLEYGCGNGRIALPLARAGVPVTGVDRSIPMLRDFRRQLRSEAPAVQRRVALRRGDMRSVNLKQRFGLVLCTFNTFLHLYDRRDVERFLGRVRQHLTSRGRFVFDLSVPDPIELARDPSRRYGSPRFRYPTTGEVVRYAERFDYDPLRQVLRVDMEFEPPTGRADAWCTPLSHRQFFPQELDALLHYNGMRVVALHGDFEPASPNRDATTLIYHCTKRR